MIKKLVIILLISLVAAVLYGIILFKRGSSIFTARAFDKVKAEPIDFKEVLQLYQEGKVIFVDVRSPANYKSEHLPGAVLYNPAETNLFSKDKIIIIYNDEYSYPQAFEAAKKFAEEGYRVYLFFDGLRIWKENGMEVHTSEGC